jgi:hypothetical protein
VVYQIDNRYSQENVNNLQLKLKASLWGGKSAEKVFSLVYKKYCLGSYISNTVPGVQALTYIVGNEAPADELLLTQWTNVDPGNYCAANFRVRVFYQVWYYED